MVPLLRHTHLIVCHRSGLGASVCVVTLDLLLNVINCCTSRPACAPAALRRERPPPDTGGEEGLPGEPEAPSQVALPTLLPDSGCAGGWFETWMACGGEWGEAGVCCIFCCCCGGKGGGAYCICCCCGV
jgi:hypothetical protein